MERLNGRVSLVRRIEFAASHSYEGYGLPEAERAALYGAGAVSMHGHNYLLEAAVEGTTDPRTGMVVNIKDVDAVMRSCVEEPLDHHFLNLDVPYFRERVPTLENLARFIWGQLAPNLSQCRLKQIRLYEHPGFWLDYLGDEAMHYLTRTYVFSAGHRLHSPALSDEENRRVFGKCNNPTGHGHNYTLEVTVCGPQDERTGTIGDIFKLDGVVEQHVLADYDHRFLNSDVPDFANLTPTAEHIVQAIWRRLAPHLEHPRLHKLRLWETARSAFDYCGE